MWKQNKEYIVEDPSRVSPEEKYPKMSQVDVDLIRSHIRRYNESSPQYKGIWYKHDEGAAILNGVKSSISTWRLEDEDGYVMIFNSATYRLDQCFEIFINTKETDPDWNYGKKKHIQDKV